jgi:serine/threonine protein kinase
VTENESGDFVRAKLRVGQVLRDKYRIDRVIGVGGMAAVYAATHRNQKQFAVKVLHTELSYREDIRTRFLREGYAANSVKHPGAVAVLDEDVAEDGAAFLVMELLEGASVEELAERAGGRLAESYAIGIAHQLLETIASAHAQGIVHRDLKPANLFVTREGQLKVLDFGIARGRDVASGGANVTGTGMLLGTPAFMAPEQALGKSAEIDAQTDLWAVGATLFTLLSGQLVHEGETPSHLMILAATTPAR